jgi:hypothetical protein
MHSYFDSIGYGCLSRRERRSTEVDIMEIHERYIDQDADDQQVNQTQTTTSKNRPSNQSSASSITVFLDSIGKKSPSSSTNVKPTNRNQLNDEMCTYRSLAQREYNLIVDGEKNSNAVSVNSQSLFAN